MTSITRSCAALAMGAALCACAGPTGNSPPPESRVLTLDTHVDIPDDYMREPRFDVGIDSALRVDLGKMQRGALDAAFFIIYVGQGPLTDAGYGQAVATAERKYSGIELMLQRYPERIRLATSPDHVLENHARGVLSAMIGMENGYSLGHDLARIDAAHARGARYLGLVHVGHIDICTSSQPKAELGDAPVATLGISAFGRDVIRRANTLGIMLDVSHASDVCVYDVLQISSAPIIASHSSARVLLDHPRNLPDNLMRAIAAKGGVIQDVAYKEFLKVDPGRKAAEKQLELDVAKLAGDTEYDNDKHDLLPAFIEGTQRIEQHFPLATLENFSITSSTSRRSPASITPASLRISMAAAR